VTLLVLASPAVATPLGELLDRVRASLSAPTPVGSVAALRIQTEVESGGRVVGSVETLARREPRALLEILDLSGVRRTITLLDDRVWIEDANGAVREATGDELVDARLSHALLFHTYLDGDAGDLRVVAAADGSLELRAAGDDDAPPRVLTFAPDAADGRWLPAAFRQRQHGVEIVTTFADWRPVSGILFPFRSEQSTGDPRFDLTLRTTACDVLEGLPDGAIAPPAERASDLVISDADSAAAISVELVENLVLVAAEVNGVRGDFLLDTGAGATVLDAGFAAELGLAARGIMEARGTGGSEPASFVDVEELRLPGARLGPQTVVSLPLAGLTDALGRPIAGILGWDFLSRFAVEIDYARARLALAPPGSYRPPPDAVRVPLRIEMNVPRAEGILDGEHRGSFLVDTGNGRGLLLHSPFVRAHGYDARESRPARDVAGVGGRKPMRSIVVDSLALGDAVFRAVPAVFAESDDGIVAIDEAIGNVGGALFRGGLLAFDYREESLWIRPPSSASASER